VLSKPLFSPALSVLPSIDSDVIEGLSFKIVVIWPSTFFELSFIKIFALPVWKSIAPGISICVALFIATPFN